MSFKMILVGLNHKRHIGIIFYFHFSPSWISVFVLQCIVWQILYISFFFGVFWSCNRLREFLQTERGILLKFKLRPFLLFLFPCLIADARMISFSIMGWQLALEGDLLDQYDTVYSNCMLNYGWADDSPEIVAVGHLFICSWQFRFADHNYALQALPGFQAQLNEIDHNFIMHANIWKAHELLCQPKINLFNTFGYPLVFVPQVFQEELDVYVGWNPETHECDRPCVWQGGIPLNDDTYDSTESGGEED